MDSLVLLGLLLTSASAASPEACTDLRSTFSEYRLAVAAGTKVAHHFSRGYLEGQVDDLLINEDEATVLHNVKATRKQVLIAPVARGDYELAARCSANIGAITLTFQSGNPRSLKLGYIREGGSWRIDKLEITLGPAGADGT